MFIYFGLLQKKLLIPLLFPLFLSLRRLIKEDNNNINNVFIGYIEFLSLTSCGIFYLILKINLKNSSKNKERNSKITNSILSTKDEKLRGINTIGDNLESPTTNTLNAMEQIGNEIEMKKIKIKENAKKPKRSLYIFASLLQLMVVVINMFWKEDLLICLKYNILNFIELFFLILFSVLFFNFSIYLHQIVSIIIIAIIFLIFFIESVIYNEIKGSEILYNVRYYAVTQLLYCLNNVFGKIYLNKTFDSPYLFLFKIGIIGSFILTIYGIISLFLKIDDKYKLFHVFTLIPIYKVLLYLFFSCLFELGLWLTIYYFTLCHYIIFETLANIIDIIFSDKDYSKGQIISFIILYPILFFSILVFNEIIILNFCGLNYNTKMEIMEREKYDLKNNENSFYNVNIEDNEFDIFNQTF